MGSSRLKVGVDIDGVLINTDSIAYLKFCEQELGWDIDYEVFAKTHSWSKSTGQKSREAIVTAVTAFYGNDEKAQEAIEGAHNALKQISAIADIFLITARMKELRTATENFLAVHLPDVSYQEVSMENSKGKGKRLIDFKIDYFIDDSYEEISSILQEKNIPTILIPFPGFHGNPDWHALVDERIHWLSAWEGLRHDLAPEQQKDIHRQAWEEIVEVVLLPNREKVSHI